jgi:hypothetical protein
MAEVTALRNNALPYPVYGVPFGVAFPILDADGDLVTGAASLDSEVSKNGDTFADCTNEATEIATSSGFYYLLLTGTEMTADLVKLIIKTATSGAKTTPLVLYPKKLPTVRSGTAQGGATGSITLDAGASPVGGAYAGCLIVATIDSVVEARICTSYDGTTKVASVTPNWNTAPDSDDTFVIYQPDGVLVPPVNTTHIGGYSDFARFLATLGWIIPATSGTFSTTQATSSDLVGWGDFSAGRWSIFFLTGAGAWQPAIVTDHDPDTGVLTFYPPLPGAPDVGDEFILLPAATGLASGFRTQDRPSGAVVTDGGNSASSFKTDLAETDNDHWKRSFLRITSGDLTGQVSRISGYNGTTKVIQLADALTATPADDVTFDIINR